MRIERFGSGFRKGFFGSGFSVHSCSSFSVWPLYEFSELIFFLGASWSSLASRAGQMEILA